MTGADAPCARRFSRYTPTHAVPPETNLSPNGGHLVPASTLRAYLLRFLYLAVALVPLFLAGCKSGSGGGPLSNPFNPTKW